MAAPVTHVIYAEKVYNKYFADKSKKDFFIGTSMPDIRYQAGLHRDHTHREDTNLEEIISKNAYEAGYLTHAFVDVKRREYIRANGIDDIIEYSPLVGIATKMIEDYILYDKIDYWDEIVDYFNDFLPEQDSLPVSKEVVLKWHKTLQDYFAQKPDAESWTKFSLALGHDMDLVNELLGHVEEYKDNQGLIKIINGFYESFDEIIVNKE